MLTPATIEPAEGQRSVGASMSPRAEHSTGMAQDQSRAAEELLPLVYGELRRPAAWHLAYEKPGQALQPTALVHGAYRIRKLTARHRKSLSVPAVVLAAIMVAPASIGWVVRDRQARQVAFEQKIAIALDDARKANLRDNLAGARAAGRSAEALLEAANADQGTWRDWAWTKVLYREAVEFLGRPADAPSTPNKD